MAARQTSALGWFLIELLVVVGISKFSNKVFTIDKSKLLLKEIDKFPTNMKTQNRNQPKADDYGSVLDSEKL